MSDESGRHYDSSVSHANKPDLWMEILFWRGKMKKLSFVILVGATAIWIAMEFYDFTLVSVLSDIAIAAVVLLYARGVFVYQLLDDEDKSDISEVEITREASTGFSNLLRRRIESAIHGVFYLCSVTRWYNLVGPLIGLYLLSEIARRVNAPTLCYIGVVGVMTLPAIYVNKQEKIDGWRQDLKSRYESLSSMTVEKVKNRMPGKERVMKLKKME